MKAKKFCVVALVLAIVLFIAPISESKAEEEPEVKTSGDYEYIVLKDETACIIRYNGEDAKVIVPEEIDGIKVMGIGDGAFEDCIDLTEITIPDSVQSIGDNAFSVCTNLTEIKIPDSVQSIGDGAFAFCENLTEINISDSIQSIGNGAFYGCDNLKKIKIPTSVKTIGKEAFKDCDNLTATVARDSYAEKYCKENNIKYMYEDSLDWLKK